MTPALLATLLIVAQAIVPHPMLSNIQEERGSTSAPMKVGTAIGAIEELGPIITAESAAVLDVESGAVLWGKRPYAVRPIASITKLATALAIVDAEPVLDTLIEVVPEDIPEEGHTVLQPGDHVAMGDLLTAMLVYSDNAAANALYRSVISTERETRVEKSQITTPRYLNVGSLPPCCELAALAHAARDDEWLGLSLADPAGLSPENRGTAIDAARLLIAALHESAIANRLRKSEATIRVRRKNKEKISGFFSQTIQSTNQLLRDGATHTFAIVGGKTGYLNESGYNLVMAAERDGHRITITLLGSASNEDRFRDARLLADWTFRNYEW